MVDGLLEDACLSFQQSRTLASGFCFLEMIYSIGKFVKLFSEIWWHKHYYCDSFLDDLYGREQSTPVSNFRFFF